MQGGSGFPISCGVAHTAECRLMGPLLSPSVERGTSACLQGYKADISFDFSFNTSSLKYTIFFHSVVKCIFLIVLT